MYSKSTGNQTSIHYSKSARSKSVENRIIDGLTTNPQNHDVSRCCTTSGM